MNNNIKISIIVPVYNTSKFLEKCIRSIIEQSFKNIEIICVNDGSTDNSLEILESLQKEDNRIIVVNKENEGASKARNIALKIAKGKYCLNIDSDDWVEQGYLKTLYERAEKDNLDITISNIIFDYISTSEKNYILNDLRISNEKVISGNEYINIFLKENFYGYTCNKLIKTELYKKNNVFYDEKIFLFEDVEAILKLANYSKRIGKINEQYYHYVQHEKNGSGKITLKAIKDVNNCFKELIEFFTVQEIKEKLYKKLGIMEIPNIIKEENITEIKYRELEKEIFNLINHISFKEIWLEKIKIVNKIYLIIFKFIPKHNTVKLLKKINSCLKNTKNKIKNIYKGLKNK